MTNSGATPNGTTQKRGKAGPHATVKFGSASVPIYLLESNGRRRFILAHYRDGKRMRKAFPDLVAAKKEALFVAQRIQSGMQHVTDLKPHERDNYAKAAELLGELKLPLVAAVVVNIMISYAVGVPRVVEREVGQHPSKVIEGAATGVPERVRNPQLVETTAQPRFQDSDRSVLESSDFVNRKVRDFLAKLLGEWGREVTLGRGAADGDNPLARELRALGDLHRRPDVGSGGNTRWKSFLLSQGLCGGKGILVGDLDDFVDHANVEVLRHEAGTNALDHMWAGLHLVASTGLGDDRAVDRLDRDDFHVTTSLQYFANTSEGAAGSNGGDEHVNLAIGVLPNFFSGCLAMDLWVGWIVKLARAISTRSFGEQLVGHRDGSTHAAGTRGKDEFGAEQAEENPTLDRHAFRHGENHAVAFRTGHESEGDAGVSRGRLDDESTGLEFPFAFGGLDHGLADTVLHTEERIEKLGLHADLSSKTLGDVVETDERGVANGGNHVFSDVHGILELEVDGNELIVTEAIKESGFLARHSTETVETLS